MALCLSHRQSGPTVALALLGICVEFMCSSDKAALPDGPATEQPGDEWAVKSSCQHRQPPTVSRGAEAGPRLSSPFTLLPLCCFVPSFDVDHLSLLPILSVSV